MGEVLALAGTTLIGIIIIVCGAFFFPDQTRALAFLILGPIMTVLGATQTWVSYRKNVRRPAHLANDEAWSRWEHRTTQGGFVATMIALVFVAWGVGGRIMALIGLVFLALIVAPLVVRWRIERISKVKQDSNSNDLP